MESIYLKTLVEVVRTGSLSRAAESLCVTQPAVSRRIKFLEEQYGRPLLDRSGPQVKATEAGRLVAEKAQSLLEIEADLEAGLHRLEGKSRLSFGSTQAFGIAHLPRILSRFMLARGDAAELKFSILPPAQLMRGVQEGSFDLAVVEGVILNDSSLTVRALPEADMVFFSARSLDLPSPETTIETLLRQPLFTRRETCCSRLLLERGLKGLGLNLDAFRSIVVLDDLHVLMETVLNGAGISFLPWDLLTDLVASERARVHVVPGFQHARQRYLVLGQGGGDPDALAILEAQILEYFKESERTPPFRQLMHHGPGDSEAAAQAVGFCCGPASVCP